MVVVVTGGVGSGKSTVSQLLAAHGAVVVDADAVAREVVEPGSAGLAGVIERFGPAVRTADGRLDRPALAAIVFEDEAARTDLNAILHPLIFQRSQELIDSAPVGCVVVFDYPLLAEAGWPGTYDLAVVVEASLPTRLRRLAGRGMAEADARARIAAQATDEQRRALADEIVVNDGDLAALQGDVGRLWGRLLARSSGVASP